MMSRKGERTVQTQLPIIDQLYAESSVKAV